MKKDTYKEKTIDDFIGLLASKASAPGGGGAAALAGALGIALGNMVGSLTVGKKTYADVEDEIIILNEEASILRGELLALIDEDEECFKPLSEAYRLPADTEDEKNIKEEQIEKCSIIACSTPLKIMEKCIQAIKIIKEYAKKGSKLAISDAGCGAALCKGALNAAALNVYINTKYLKDKKIAKELNDKADAMLEEGTRLADEIFESIKSNLR